MKTFYRWTLINLLLPLSPFALRVFVSLMGREEILSFKKIAELPEILFFSIYLCVVNLNINLDGRKGYFEFTLRLFLGLILILDCVVLGMIYSNNIGSNVFPFSLIAALIPAAIAPVYKFRYERSIE